MVDQDLAHRPRRYRKKMRQAAPGRLGLAGQAQVSLVHESGGIQALVSGPAAPPLPGQRAQLAVHARQQLIERLPVAFSELPQEVVDGFWGSGGSAAPAEKG
jgi:hypothetical protein